MIDFVSTREDTNAEIKQYCELLAAVIAQALRDLCVKPMVIELEKAKNIDRHAVKSLIFFFSPKSPFKVYATMIGLSPKEFTDAMMNRKYDGSLKNPYLSYSQIKSMQTRIKWWNSIPESNLL